MKKLLLLFIPVLVYSCVPVKIAPNIESNKVMKAKKFKRHLPDQYAFIFEDPKDANEFYNYVNTKFKLDDKNVDTNVPIEIGNTTYFMSFYETERETKTVNLVPIAVDAKRESNGNSALLEDVHTSRKGQWYLALTVTDANGNNQLNLDNRNRQKIINHLEKLRNEYLSTANYYDVLFKKKKRFKLHLFIIYNT